MAHCYPDCSEAAKVYFDESHCGCFDDSCFISRPCLCGLFRGIRGRQRLRQKEAATDPPEIQADVPATPVQTMDNFAAERGITRSVLVKLIRMGWPLMMFNILFVLNRTSQTIPHLDCVEFYAGEAMIAQAFKVAGLNSAAYDICYEPTQHDATGPEGLLNAAHLALQLKERGMSSWGTVPYALY